MIPPPLPPIPPPPFSPNPFVDIDPRLVLREKEAAALDAYRIAARALFEVEKSHAAKKKELDEELGRYQAEWREALAAYNRSFLEE